MAKSTEPTEHDAAEAALDRKNRAGKLDDWRRGELLSLGFSLYQAEILTQTPGLYAADVRESYISKGCSVDLAWKILCPHECAEDRY